MLHEPGVEPRLVQIDQAKLRAEHAAGKRAAAVRLNYAMHSFPAQGATVHGTATLAGHWSQAKQETYVGDTRAIYRHTVHLAREDLGTNGTDEDRLSRYAQRISDNRQRHASIRSRPDPTVQLAVRLPDHQALPNRAALTGATGRGYTSPRSSTTSPTPAGGSSPSPGTVSAVRQLAHSDGEVEHVCTGPSEQLVRALGPMPQERIARERWQREARRLEALRFRSNAIQDPAPAPAAPTQSPTTSRPAAPPLPSQRIAPSTTRP